MTANAFTMKSWDEQIVSGDKGAEGAPRVAHAHAGMRYSGVIDGESTCDFLLYYPGEGYDGGGITSAGLERIEGSVDGRKGSFVIRHEVGFDLEGIQGVWAVVEGSGLGELAGLSGTGTAAGEMGEETVAYTFDYAFK
jgi:hypothetical protein